MLTPSEMPKTKTTTRKPRKRREKAAEVPMKTVLVKHTPEEYRQRRAAVIAIWGDPELGDPYYHPEPPADWLAQADQEIQVRA